MSRSEDFQDFDETGSDPTILIVEDEVLLRMALADFLQECGYRVLQAGTAAEARAILSRHMTDIELVFTDVKMPGDMDGFGLANWVRAHHPGTPVFIASGYTGKNRMAHELCAGEPFFAKPYDLDRLAAKIQDAVVERRRHIA